MTTILDLSTELLHQVALYFDAEDGGGPEVATKIRTLKNLTETCHRLRSIAQPVLFGNLIINDAQSNDEASKEAPSAKQMVQFTRTLLSRPDLGEKLLHLCLRHLDVSAWPSSDIRRYLSQTEYEELLEANPVFYEPQVWKFDLTNGHWYPFLAYIVSCATRMEAFHFPMREEISDCLHQLSQAHEHILKNMSDLQMTGESHGASIDLGRYIGFAMASPKLFFMDVSQGWATATTTNTEHIGHALQLEPNTLPIKHLVLRDFHMGIKPLRNLLDAITALKYFEFSAEHESANDNRPFTPPQLVSALDKHKDTLQELSAEFDTDRMLIARHRWHTDTDNDDVDPDVWIRNGQHPMPSLAQFSALKELHTEFDRLPALEELPPNLQKLTYKAPTAITETHFNYMKRMPKALYPSLLQVFMLVDRNSSMEDLEKVAPKCGFKVNKRAEFGWYCSLEGLGFECLADNVMPGSTVTRRKENGEWEEVSRVLGNYT